MDKQKGTQSFTSSKTVNPIQASSSENLSSGGLRTIKAHTSLCICPFVICLLKSIISRLAMSRDANHSDFCGISPFFKANFRITILDVKFRKITILHAKMVPDKIKDVTLKYTPVLRTYYVAVDNYT